MIIQISLLGNDCRLANVNKTTHVVAAPSQSVKNDVIADTSQSRLDLIHACTSHLFPCFNHAVLFINNVSLHITAATTDGKALMQATGTCSRSHIFDLPYFRK